MKEEQIKLKEIINTYENQVRILKIYSDKI